MRPCVHHLPGSPVRSRLHASALRSSAVLFRLPLRSVHRFQYGAARAADDLLEKFTSRPLPEIVRRGRPRNFPPRGGSLRLANIPARKRNTFLRPPSQGVLFLHSRG